MPTLLVVDDSTFMRNLVRVILEDEPIDIVAEAINGVAGVDAYKEHDPDLVVMNVRMPIMEGIEATEEIIEYDSDATVIICTGVRQQAKMKAAVRAGAEDYVTKPFQRDSFLAALQDALDATG
jgi:two-component system chemotaxis response regulator CheY